MSAQPVKQPKHDRMQNAEQSPEDHNCTHIDEVKLPNNPVTSTKP